MFSKIINKFSVVIDPSKFPKGELLSLYKSNEGTNIKLFNVFYAGFIGYNVYQFYSDKEMSKYAIDDLTAASYQSGMESSIILAGMLSLGMIFFYWKTSKTLFNLWLSPNGKEIVMDSYSLFGLNSKTQSLDIVNFKGFCYFLHPSLRIPMFRYKIGDSQKSMFFKHQYVLDEAAMKSILQGHEIIVKPKGMEKEPSQSQKKKYGL